MTERENRPAGDRAASRKSTGSGYHDSSVYRRHDGYTAPTPEDRAVASAIAVLRAHGYGVFSRCLDCRRPITASVSVARMRGPRCAARAEVAQ